MRSSDAAGQASPPTTLDALRARIDAELRDLDLADRRWFVHDHPAYPNPGDALLWLAVRQAAARLGAEVVGCDAIGLAPATATVVQATPPDVAVLLQPGGNLGGLYPAHDEHRIAVLRRHVDRPIVQLPQSVEWVEGPVTERLVEAVRRHGRFVLLVRDRRSLERARARLECEVRLVPDLALGVGGLVRPARQAGETVVARRDQEAGVRRDGPVPGPDWGAPDPLERVVRRLWHRVARRDAHRAVALGTWLARRQVDGAIGRVGGAQTLVTDRLHGHVLALLLGVPHVVVDDAHGKVAALVDTWTRPLGGFEQAGSWAEVPDRLAALGRRSDR